MQQHERANQEREIGVDEDPGGIAALVRFESRIGRTLPPAERVAYLVAMQSEAQRNVDLAIVRSKRLNDEVASLGVTCTECGRSVVDLEADEQVVGGLCPRDRELARELIVVRDYLDRVDEAIAAGEEEPEPSDPITELEEALRAEGKVIIDLGEE